MLLNPELQQASPDPGPSTHPAPNETEPRRFGPGTGPEVEPEFMILGTTAFLWTLPGQEFTIHDTTAFLGNSSGQESMILGTTILPGGPNTEKWASAR